MKDKKSPEYIAVSLLFYSFIIAMLVFVIFRFCGIAWFSQNYVPFETNKFWYYTISILLKCFEGTIILMILSKIKLWYAILIALVYSFIIFFIQNLTIEFCLDIIYTFSIPFIFNNNKDKSIIYSFIYFIGVCLYQLLMSFARYNMTFIGKYDLGYAFLSLIDYRFFLISILLFKILYNKRRL